MMTDNLGNPPAESGDPQVLSVSALNQAVARALERNFPLLWVAGEISNFTCAASGHWYFTLKDAGAQVRAVMFRGRAQHVGFMPREGDRVEVRALVTLYAPRGDYQLSVEAVRRAGLGNLYEAFLQLKEKLTREGLFDAARKRPLPVFAKAVGIVTSLQAAALRDVLTALRRRAPHVRVIVYPAPVQGDGAAARIAAAVRTASARAECDVLLVCRGGGSIEDLWSFNDEEVARAIVACGMPVISGVGHETDFTLADFAADVRAPTPTAAAELAAVPRAEWLATVAAHAGELARAYRRQLATTAQTVDWLSRRLASPATTIRHSRLKLQGMQARLMHAARAPLGQAKFALMQSNARLAALRPEPVAQRNRLREDERRLGAALAALVARRRQALAALQAQLELLNPQRTLERGYALAIDARGNIVRAPKQLRPRENLTLKLAEGTVALGIATVQENLDPEG